MKFKSSFKRMILLVGLTFSGSLLPSHYVWAQG
jgi:hypothetical protein